MRGARSGSRVANAASRVRELREGAVSTVSNTPGWVWVVLGGVALLIIGLIAAQRVRASRGALDVDDAPDGEE